MATGLGTVTVKLKLSRSEEREAIAKFVEIAFEKKWSEKLIIDMIRSGDYLTFLIQQNSPSEVNRGSE